MFKRLLHTNNDPVFTIIRLALGTVFFAHGAQKMLGWFGGYGFAETLRAFSTLGMPAALALFVILTEFLGSFALICGVFARVASEATALLMVGDVLVSSRTCPSWSPPHHKDAFATKSQPAGRIARGI